MINIKNIIFDIGGVLTIGKTYTVLDNLDIDSNTYNDLKRFFDNCEELDLGTMTLEEKFNNCNFDKEIELKYKEYVINYYKHRKFNTELFDLIKRLKKNNYNVYILSDNNKELYNYYRSSELFKNIDGWVLSCDYGTIKKDGKLFDIILDKFNLNPSECYFIDDNEINVNEAKNHKIEAFIYNYNEGNNKLYDDMKNKGIAID